MRLQLEAECGRRALVDACETVGAAIKSEYMPRIDAPAAGGLTDWSVRTVTAVGGKMDARRSPRAQVAVQDAHRAQSAAPEAAGTEDFEKEQNQEESSGHR